MAEKKKHIFKKGSLTRAEAKYGYAFIAPMLIGFIIFVLIPIIATFCLSFTNYSLLSGMEFCGFSNYVKMLTKDATFTKSVVNTLYFTVLLVPTNFVLCLGLALLIQENIKGIGFFRTAIFTPYITSIVVWALIWKFMFQTENGFVNVFLRLLNIAGVNWLYNEKLAIPLVVFVTLTKGFGMNTIIFINALQDVPRIYYEAAELDGASAIQRFRRITLPMISPTVFLVLIITMIGSLKVFTQINVMTEGGPGTSSYVLVYYIYQKAFRLQQFGYASAISVILFIVIMILTLLQWKVRSNWVFYEN